ncbi:ubiquitin carboxyl-terminal hydrolase CYLD [Chanos chanos]|uniref:Ubiquitin carboxyl-terminal hydrolase CYLD n=1 Tax=Chanos chanos TaxID=29144 RepID=A0A6J2WS12_CHACN|nr:ubiquitin carboxyl-terminal hydrolase CYLD-like [Chanos chanos]
MGSTDKYMYFIVLEKPGYPCSHISRGAICYIEEEKYRLKIERLEDGEKVDSLQVKFQTDVVDKCIKMDVLDALSPQEAGLLQAIEGNEDRLKAYRQRDALDRALNLKTDSLVTVELNGKWLEGVVRYIGRKTDFSAPISGTFFGIELQGKGMGKGQNNGSVGTRTLFTCKQDCGIFAPFTRVKPAHPESSAPFGPPSDTQSKPFSIGDRVTFFVEDIETHGMVMNLEEKEGRTFLHISTDKDEKGKRGGDVTVPLECVISEDLLPSSEREVLDTSEGLTDQPMEICTVDITKGSLVEVTLATGPAFGIVRWIGNLPSLPGVRAGLELEEDLGVNDGTFKGERYFKCPAKRGLFVKLSSCRPDSRFFGDDDKGKALHNGHTDDDAACWSGVQENVPPIVSEEVEKLLIGTMKGVQGHCNSCYMDSALFSLFSCSSVLDSLLFKSVQKVNQRYQAIQTTLLKDIVNPLRSKGFVPGHSVMKLRQQLQDGGHCPTYTTDEKDPEEFLTLLMQQILSLDPLLKLANTYPGSKDEVESCYFYQIFLDYDHNLVLPCVQQLLEHSLYINGLRLAEVPSCLILTMPRSGKKFKMFQKIIPSSELDITALLSGAPQPCVLCGQLASMECVECFKDSLFGSSGFKHFCHTCSEQVHMHKLRRSHKQTRLRLPEGFPRGVSRPPPQEKLELFAVLCIETSHYVSFVKHGPKDTDWIFFDSMADREGERDGFNIPQVTACPEIGRYLRMTLAELANQVPREMDGVAKRLFCDGYMYLYQSPNMALYH